MPTIRVNLAIICGANAARSVYARTRGGSLLGRRSDSMSRYKAVRIAAHPTWNERAPQAGWKTGSPLNFG